MEPNFSYGTLKINQEIFNQTVEQPLELDYQLPDYCTGIFKMLQFRAEPHICSFRHSGDQFTIDGNTIIKLIYIDEDEGNLKSIHQNVPFSKTIKLNENFENPCAFYNVKTNYSNCKIISSKKIEIKGSLTISIKIYDQVGQKVIQNLSEEETTRTGIHTKKQLIKAISKQIWNTQQFKIAEQIEFETPIEDLIDLKIGLIENEHKTILNKIISKATLYFDIIYCSTDKKTILTKQTKIPINQILEMQDVNENFLCEVNYDISSFTSSILQDGKVLKINADAVVKSYASLSKTLEMISDIFSTKFECNINTKNINLINTSESIKENVELTERLSMENFKKIIDLNAEISNLESEQISNDRLNFKAKLKINAYGFSNDETPEIYEKSIPITFTVKKAMEQKINKKAEFKANILKLEFVLDENKNLILKIDFQIYGLINDLNQISIIDKVELNEKELKTKTDAALTLFYPQPNDEVWEIAKRFSACPKDIIEANGLTSETITNEVMLIIPVG